MPRTLFWMLAILGVGLALGLAVGVPLGYSLPKPGPAPSTSQPYSLRTPADFPDGMPRFGNDEEHPELPESLALYYADSVRLRRLYLDCLALFYIGHDECYQYFLSIEGDAIWFISSDEMSQTDVRKMYEERIGIWKMPAHLRSALPRAVGVASSRSPQILKWIEVKKLIEIDGVHDQIGEYNRR